MADITHGECCENCLFWAEFEGSGPPLDTPIPGCPDEGYGYCRRYPPVLLRPLRDEEDPHDTDLRGGECRPGWAQPLTLGNDWCGEWRGILKEMKHGNP